MLGDLIAFNILYLKIKFKDKFCSKKPLYKYKLITMGI